jgi:hypothetical protein
MRTLVRRTQARRMLVRRRTLVTSQVLHRRWVFAALHRLAIFNYRRV